MTFKIEICTMRKLFIIVLLAPFIANLYAAQPTGTIKGIVLDQETMEPLLGVNVILMNSEKGSATNEKGEFHIANVAIGSYSLAFYYIGYEKLIRSDVIVRPNRITFLNVGLLMSSIEGQEVTVTAGFFHKEENEPVSVYNFTVEEVRRSPGSAGDVSRILLALPSAARVADNANDLMVRGGSPVENGFFIDNIQIPNINHYPSIGSTGGPIGVLNVDFIDDVTFYTGGFSAAYGDRLSSIIDIKFREGNKEEIDKQLDMSMAGFGGILEGPLPNEKGSWLFSARKSYLDLIVDAIGTGVAPRYGDVQGKIIYDINKKNRLTFLDIYANNRIDYKRDESIDSGDPFFGGFKGQQNTFGMNWRYLWSENGYSNTSISNSMQLSNDNWFNTKKQNLLINNDSNESAINIRNTNFYRFDNSKKIEFGGNVSYDMSNYNYFMSADTTAFITGAKADTLIKKEIDLDQNFSTTKAGLFFSFIYKPVKKLTTTLGLRGDYFSYNEKFQLSPRFSMAYQLTNLLSINAASGIFYQNLPLYLLTQSNEYKNLDTPKAIHYIIGVDYMIREDTKLTIEVYDKEYDNFPLTKDDPTLFVLDDGRSMTFFRNYDLTGGGKAYTRGAEFLAQKKLAKDFYGLVSASVFRSKYKDLLGKWRNRTYDNRYLFSIISGYKPNNKWEFSLRWNYAGGVPYTPLDIESLSSGGIEKINTDITNSARYPDYHSLNIRFDRRFHFQRSNIVVFLSLWNVYNRKNIASYYWNEIENKQDEYYQWSFIPIGGFEYEL
jgi:hypothetical protein